MPRLITPIFYSALASLTIALSSPGALAQSRPAPRNAENDRRALMALEDEWLSNSRTPATLERILAPDFVHVIESGPFLTKAQHIAWCEQNPLPANHRSHFERLQVRLYGDVGIASGIVSNSSGGARPTRTAFTDVFAFRNGRWQAVNAQETRMTRGPR
jgi:hypothetical protein